MHISVGRHLNARTIQIHFSDNSDDHMEEQMHMNSNHHRLPPIATGCRNGVMDQKNISKKVNHKDPKQLKTRIIKKRKSDYAPGLANNPV